MQASLDALRLGDRRAVFFSCLFRARIFHAEIQGSQIVPDSVVIAVFRRIFRVFGGQCEIARMQKTL